MFILELIAKNLLKLKKKDLDADYLIEDSSEDVNNPEDELCNHVFMPIDSTNETLACSNCGLVVKKSELKNKNFFVR